MTDWQLIDTAPKDGTACLVSDGKYVLRAYFNDYPKIWEGKTEDGCWTVYEPDDFFHAWHLNEDPPTHWMPLPDAPK